jgi:hypothetical protein
MYRIVYNPQTKKYEPVIEQPAPAVNMQQPQAPASPIQANPGREPIQPNQTSQPGGEIGQITQQDSQQDKLYDTDLIAKQGQEINAKRNAATDQAIQDQDKVSKSYIDDLANITQGFYKQHQASLEEQEEAAQRARKVQTVNAINDGITSLANLYFTTKGAPSAPPSSFSTRYQEQYDQAQAKREQLQRELRTSLNESERSLADKNLTLQHQSINSRLAAQNQALAGEEKAQADVRSAEAQNKQFAQKTAREKIDDERQERALNLREQDSVADRALKKEQQEQLADYRTNQNEIRKETNRIRGYDLERKNFLKEQGEPIAITSGDQTYTLGSNNLPTLAEDVYNDLMQSYNEDIDKVNASGKKKRDREKEIIDIDDVRRLISSKYKDLKTDKEKASFVAQYAAQSPKAMEKIKKLSQDYQDKATEIEDKYSEATEWFNPFAQEDVFEGF